MDVPPLTEARPPLLVEQPSDPSGDQPEAQEPVVIPTRRILIIGDSEACAVRWARAGKRLATDALRRPLDTVQFECKGGTTVEYWNNHIHSTLDKFPNVNIAIVFLGTNHFSQRTAPDPSPILAELAARGISCLWVGGTAVNGRSWPVYPLLRDKVEPQCTYFDTVAAGIPLEDGVHPNSQGGYLWLSKLWPYIPER